MKKPISGKFVFVAGMFAATLSNLSFAGTITNKDVVRLLDAGMQEDVVLQAIANGTPKFDTSASGLINLKKKGATPAILKAMISPEEIMATQAAPAAEKLSFTALAPEEISLLVDNKETLIQRFVPGTRITMRAFGLGDGTVRAVLQGGKALTRLKQTTPEFIVSVPKNVQAGTFLLLARLEVTDTPAREIVIASQGISGFTTGIPLDRMIAVATEQLPDQSRARDGLVLYRVKPEKPMVNGEYALVLATGEVRSLGFANLVVNSFVDFGLD